MKLRTDAAHTVDILRFDVANRLFFRLYQSSNLMHKNGTKAVASFGSTTQQWAVMGALARPRRPQRGHEREGADRLPDAQRVRTCRRSSIGSRHGAGSRR